MDFYQIKENLTKSGVLEIYPDFKVGRSKDLMVRGKSFYALWDDERGIWSTDEYDVQRLIDKELYEYRESVVAKTHGAVRVKFMSDFSTKTWPEFRYYMASISDNAHQLDEHITFKNTEVKKKDYVSKRLPYSFEEGSIDAYEEIISTLYEPGEREKLEWAIGSIISGDSKSIQKFIVLYGEAGTGKSTILNIIQQLFEGYYTTFEAKALTASSNAFATEVFKNNPLVAIQHDGDLSKIEDNSKLNSIVSHEEMTMNEKYKPSYTSRINSFLFMGTNKPVKITDAKSGLLRRLIDVKPSGNKLAPKRYQALVSQVSFELGAIAFHCLNVYRELGKNYYSHYKPLDMMMQTDVFFNFIEQEYFIFKEQDGCSLAQAYELYKRYCDEALIDFKLPRHKFREELKNYFKVFRDSYRLDGKQVRSYYSGFILDKFKSTNTDKNTEHQNSLTMDETESLLDVLYGDCKAQYASASKKPKSKWDEVKTKLCDIDTSLVHYVIPPGNHIVIDFDLKDADGKKSMILNIEAASKWPKTYAEYSMSGGGIHLHYLYDGDPSNLAYLYSENIEIKVFSGGSSLRRKFTKCNNIPVATIKGGLPLKGERMINFEGVKNEKILRDLIKKNLRKEIHHSTKPSVDFIFKLLEDMYNSGASYDVTDLRPSILAFANNSTNQADICLQLVRDMKYKSDEISIPEDDDSEVITFFDIECFQNLFLVVYKHKGGKCIPLINPKPSDIEPLLRMKLVGFNCRRYDNHMLYARYLGYNEYQCYTLSQRIISNSKNALFGEAYNISHADIYEYASEKKSLKKWQIDLGIHHQELGLAWEEPVPENMISKVVEYCCNDVDSTEVVFDDRYQDYVARLILSELSGLVVNERTQSHAAKIIFGNDKRPQDSFEYVDLSKDFPGYTFENGKSFYRGEEIGEGGYVYAEPGIYGSIPVMDITSMHPRTIIVMNHFGKYTKNFEMIVDARVAIKHENYKVVETMLNGILTKYLSNKEDADRLSYALKIVINIVYGMTSAKFDNPFKDPRNVDNIVAKRGALFMVDLKHAVQEKGFKVAHIKTDSIKIPEATDEMLRFVSDFGAKYGYTFEHEATYEKMCLVNDAVFISKYGWAQKEKFIGKWSATGAQFAHPYVFKTLFTEEQVEFKDLTETKSVSTKMFLDFNEGLPNVSIFEKVRSLRLKTSKDINAQLKFTNSEKNTLNAWHHLSDEELLSRIDEGHNYHFIGKVGSFVPVKSGVGGGLLVREKDGLYHSANGAKGYRWMETEMVEKLNKEDMIDYGLFHDLVNDAVDAISKFGDFNWFKNDDVTIPWIQYDERSTQQ